MSHISFVYFYDVVVIFFFWEELWKIIWECPQSEKKSTKVCKVDVREKISYVCSINKKKVIRKEKQEGKRRNNFFFFLKTFNELKITAKLFLLLFSTGKKILFSTFFVWKFSKNFITNSFFTRWFPMDIFLVFIFVRFWWLISHFTLKFLNDSNILI